MIRRTVGDVKADLARIAGACGMSATDTRVLDYLNLATEELMNEGDWPSLIDRYIFKVYGGTVTLPGPYERMLQCKVNDTGMVLQSPWFEFVGAGPTLISEYNNDSNTIDWLQQLQGVLDRDGVLTFTDIPDPADGVKYTIRLETQVDERIDGELPDNVLIMGLDDAGEAIRSGSGSIYHDGIEFQWATGSGSTQYAESTQFFSLLTEAVKPVTLMPINVYMVSDEDGTKTLIGKWGANETSPSYRRYRINGLNATEQYTITARVRKRFKAVASDSDVLLISNMPALRSMMLAVFFYETGDLDRYAVHKTQAIDLLNKEAKAYRGQQRRKPLITFNEGTGTRTDGYYVL